MKRLRTPLLVFLLIALFGAYAFGGATFSRVKTWVSGEALTAADLNAEFQNILDNLAPAGIDDYSTNTAAMQSTADPYPASVASLATSLQGELQRLRYVIRQLGGKTYWYEDPVVTVSASGHTVNTSQSAFSVKPSAAQENIAVGVGVTVVFDTEIFDQGGDFAANVFTAPVTGKYQLNLFLQLQQIDTGATSYRVSIVTSNRTYLVDFDPARFSADVSLWPITMSVLADMDAGDTAYVGVLQTGGAQQTDIQNTSYFSGFLAH